MTQEELVARLRSIYVWCPSASVARRMLAELIVALGGRVPNGVVSTQQDA